MTASDAALSKGGGFSFRSLAEVRKQLLDLSNRNSLLNFRHGKTNSLRFIDELPDQIYDVLRQGKSFTVIPVPEPTEQELFDAGYLERTEEGEIVRHEYPSAEKWARQKGLNTNYGLPVESQYDNSSKHTDTRLQTLKYAPELEASLSKIRSRSTSAIEETGANILYLALGFLEWFESRDSDVPRLAPLFTIPVELTRGRSKKRDGTWRYSVSMKDDGLLTNTTLREKLAHEFGLDLPAIEDETTPEQYFSLLENTTLAHQPRWRIRRYGTLALLNFAKQTMYEDLDPAKWPEGKRLEDHALLKKFFGGGDSEFEGGSLYPEERPIDETADQHKRYPLIYDADSSQHSALMDVVDGESLVIEGPPGTGKSQTITNLIAACLANGKSVLFVAEKMAALEVVKDRLDKADLGDFCLELHSHRTQKQKLLSDLTSRLNKRYRQANEIETEVERYEAIKSKLVNYVSKINSTWRSTGLTIHQILTGATRYRGELGINPDSIQLEGITGEATTGTRQRELCDLAKLLRSVYEQVADQSPDGNIERHYWYGVGRQDLAEQHVPELCGALDKWTGSLGEVQTDWASCVNELSLTSDSDPELEEISQALNVAASLPNLSGREPLSLIPTIAQDLDRYETALAEYGSLKNTIETLGETIQPGVVTEAATVGSLRQAVAELDALGAAPDLTLQQVGLDNEVLVTTQGHLADLGSLFEKMRPSLPKDVSDRLVLSQEGLSEFTQLADLVGALPGELWPHRDSRYDNPDMDAPLSELSTRIERLQPLHNLLKEQIHLHRLPPSTELRTRQLTLEGGGLFRWFSSEWRKARTDMKDISSQPKVKSKKLLSLAPTVSDYQEQIEGLEKVAQTDALLKEMFQGAETPIEKIATLRSWYKAVRDNYGTAFGPRAEIGTWVLAMDRRLANAILAAANQGGLAASSDVLTLAEDLRKRYQRFAPLRQPDQPLSGEQGAIDLLAKSLGAIDSQLRNIVSRSDIDGTTLRRSALVAEDLHRRLNKWQSQPQVQSFNSAGVALNPASGQSQESVTLLQRVLEAVKLGLTNPVILSGLVANPTAAGYERLQQRFGKMRVTFSKMKDNAKTFADTGEVNLGHWGSSSRNRVRALIDRNKGAMDNPMWLTIWVDYLLLKKRLTAQGLQPIAAGLEKSDFSSDQLESVLQFAIHHQLAREIYTVDEEIRNASGLELNAAIEQFREYDKRLLQLQRQRIAFEASRKQPPAGVGTGLVKNYSQTALLKHESGKKKRHIAIRALMRRAGSAIKTLKPCFMMSPMSVAQYLAPGQFTFDVVVMDEASQILPEDAVGAVARGSQLVVVGDPKQLPPTNFFRQITESEGDEEESALGEAESILNAAIPMFKTRRLRWHYRSRHESLIQFSNQEFYDSDLVIFPSPLQESKEFGVRFKRVARGRLKNRRNVEEASAIVEAAVQQMQNHPDESVGIVAMNIQQRDEIEQQLEQQIKDEPLAHKAFENNQRLLEPLFVKNLENVQGDERDVILISMTYGPEQVGGRVMQRFGPINQSVGWRRLNVLFTRSKKRMLVFSSMNSTDILTDAKSLGVKALRAFLEYCETGHLHHTVVTGKNPDSDFEVAVMRKLWEHGFECEAQLGVAGYSLDLAVRDPGQPGRFLMGIECDGATYHSAKSARDRDRLRQEILAGLGWTLRRIWSTDWFKNPEAQLRPILRDLEARKTAAHDTELPDDISPQLQPVEDANQGADLRTRLEILDSEVIRREFPRTDPDRRLLRPEMMQLLLNHSPCSKREFYQCVPQYLRERTDIAEARGHLDTVLELVADYG